MFCPCQKDKINSHSPHLAACGLVSSDSHSPQTICGSRMVSGLCLTPGVLIQRSPQTSLNMKYHVKPDSCSKPFPSCGYIRRPRPCLRILSDFSNAGVRWEDYVCLDFHTVSFCTIPHWMAETLASGSGLVKTYAAFRHSWKFPPGTLQSKALLSPAVIVGKPQGRKINA